ncbi:MAG: hypothetical protein U9O98_09165 [Asgard group archaeon]|nr:hypothetical protein [Asgard group archaeon]
MGYEMTRPAQKWLGIISVLTSLLLMLFTLAVPYVNHFGTDEDQFTYYTRWNGRWRSDLLPPNTFENADLLLNFPKSASWLIGLGVLLMIGGAVYLFWITYTNRADYILREKPGPIGGGIIVLGSLLYLTGSLIYENWAYGSPRPLSGWPGIGTGRFLTETVRLAPTFWIGFAFALILFGLGFTSIIYYLDTLSKRPVK